MFDFVTGFGGVVAANGIADDQVEEGKKVEGLGTFGRGGQAQVEFIVWLLGEDKVPIVDGLHGERIGGPFLDGVAGRFIRRSYR